MIKFGILTSISILVVGLFMVGVPLYMVETHHSMVLSVPEILENDGHILYAQTMDDYMADILRGETQADEASLLSSREHFMNPVTHNGLGGFRSAGDLANELFATGVNDWLDGDKENSMFKLGKILHLVQDLTVPHHAVPTLLNGHLEYEKWYTTDIVIEKLTANTGNYDHDTIFDYLLYNGEQSLSHFKYVDLADNDDDFDYCASQMVPLAQSTSAGAAVLYFEAIEAETPLVYEGSFDWGTLGIYLVLIGVVSSLFCWRYKK